MQNDAIKQHCPLHRRRRYHPRNQYNLRRNRQNSKHHKRANFRKLNLPKTTDSLILPQKAFCILNISRKMKINPTIVRTGTPNSLLKQMERQIWLPAQRQISMKEQNQLKQSSCWKRREEVISDSGWGGEYIGCEWVWVAGTSGTGRAGCGAFPLSISIALPFRTQRGGYNSCYSNYYLAYLNTNDWILMVNSLEQLSSYLPISCGFCFFLAL